MLKRLEGDGLIERGEHKEALLTAGGRERAERVVRRHRLIERLLTDFMGYTAAEAHVTPTRSARASATNDRAHRRAARQPRPLPSRLAGRHRLEQAENSELAALADLEPGDRAEIVRLAEHDGDLLHWFTTRASSRRGGRGARGAAGAGS